MDREVTGPRRRRWSDGASAALDPNGPWTMGDQWPVVVGTLAGAQLDAVRVVNAAVAKACADGRMDAAEAAALRRATADLQHTSMRAQQITRLAGGRIRQFRELLDMSQVVRSVLRDRTGGVALSEIVARAELEPLTLHMDAAVAYAVVEGLLAWLLARCRDVQIRTATQEDGGLLMASGRRDPEIAARERRRRLEDGLDLLLARQAADAAGLALTVRQDQGFVAATVEFPLTVAGADILPGIDFSGRVGTAVPEWVVVITRDEGLISSAAYGLAHAGFEVRGARTARDARSRLAATPVAIVLDEAATGGEFDVLREELLGPAGPRPLIEITRARPRPQLPPGAADLPRLAREDVVPDIAATLLFELAKAS